MITKRIYRLIQSVLFFLTAVVVAFSFYFEYAKGMQPCPLCMMQRITAILLGMFCLMGVCLSTLHRGRLVAGFQIVFALAGVYFSGRQLWLQSLPPDQKPASMPGLDIMMEYFPWHEVLRVLFWGAGDCAELNWQWLGLSMPAWSALYFLFVLITSIIVFWFLGRTLKQVA